MSEFMNALRMGLEYAEKNGIPEPIPAKETGNPHTGIKVWLTDLNGNAFQVTLHATKSIKMSGIPAGASKEQRRALLALKALRESGQSLENVG
jgi:hypothetical protein